jgi:hypothetical protein
MCGRLVALHDVEERCDADTQNGQARNGSPASFTFAGRNGSRFELTIREHSRRRERRVRGKQRCAIRLEIGQPRRVDEERPFSTIPENGGIELRITAS